MDDKTLARRGIGRGAGATSRGPTTPRMLYRLREDGPAVIALDVVFDGKPTRGDRALLDAIRATHDSSSCRSETSRSWKMPRPPEGPAPAPRPRAVDATAVKTGYVALPADKDGHNRRADYRVVIDPTKGLSAAGS